MKGSGPGLYEIRKNTMKFIRELLCELVCFYDIAPTYGKRERSCFKQVGIEAEQETKSPRLR